ncbi:MAG: LPS export ABC transporter periplasmic protein LptC [Bacteroidaceae bacterium]|nr:LPS export ABC transporter periplasmic protein LptC [Bacteroidaceae bacterium]
MGLFSCQEEDTGTAVDVPNREDQPILKSVGVSTLISDSGVIRYKIISEDWFIYDRKDPPYYSFEKGLFLEKFDENYHVDAFINCDTAYYYNMQRLWELRGRVCVKNLKGETFKTSLLYWDMTQHQIYSPAYMVIDGIEQDLEGYDFKSNESMSEYIIHSSSGAFPMGEDREVPRPDEQELIMFRSDTNQVNTTL